MGARFSTPKDHKAKQCHADDDEKGRCDDLQRTISFDVFWSHPGCYKVPGSPVCGQDILQGDLPCCLLVHGLGHQTGNV